LSRQSLGSGGGSLGGRQLNSYPYIKPQTLNIKHGRVCGLFLPFFLFVASIASLISALREFFRDSAS